MDPAPQGESCLLRSQTFPFLQTLYTLISSFDIPQTPPLTPMSENKQHKQRYYYIFWSIATLAVISGQIHVANSYNRLSNNLEMTLINYDRER